jgi:hypothetical protein
MLQNISISQRAKQFDHTRRFNRQQKIIIIHNALFNHLNKDRSKIL